MPGFRPVDPKQSFPRLEEEVLERWRERDVFARSVEQAQPGVRCGASTRGRRPRTAGPDSHHVLSRVFKDIYPRYRTMTGHRVPRKAGWDCHGLPVELEVEKELGISSKAEIEEYGIAEFNARCRESVFRYVEEWNRLTERIGFWIDLDDPYVTMEDDYIESGWWALRRMWDDGRLYEGHKVVPYCPRCGTALSSHEVALGYHDVEDLSVYVKLPIREVPPSDQIPESPLEPGDLLLVWTTTPWTLISNAAVAAGAEIEYVRARGGEKGAGPARSSSSLATAWRRSSARAPRSSPTSRARPWRARATSRPSATSPTTAPAATRSCWGTSSPPRTARGSSTPPSPSARTTSGSARSTGSRCRTRSRSRARSTSGSPTSPAARSRRPTPT